MPYGTIKVDTITFTSGSSDVSVAISGLVQNPTFSGNVTVTGTVSGTIVRGNTVSGATVTGTAGQFGTLTGDTAGFTTVTGTTVTGTTANFVTVSGNTLRTITGIFASGSAASPSITFSGDLDTGLFTGAANTVGIAASGAAVLTVSGTSVGIGTGSPDSLFEISTSTTTPQLFISNLSTTIASGGTIGTIDYRAGSSKTVVARLGATADSVNEDGAHIVFENRTAAGALTEKLRITSAGAVGIGTNSPAAQLETIGIVRSYRQVSGSTSLLHDWYSDNGGTKILQHEFQAAGNVYHRGNVGIGTTTADEKLHISGTGDIKTKIVTTSTGANANSALWLDAGTEGSWVIQTGNAVADGLRFYDSQAGSERARIDSTGKFGIGTTSPNTAFSIGTIGSFDVDSNSVYIGNNFSGTGLKFNKTGNYAQRIFLDTATNNIKFENTGSTGTAGNNISWTTRLTIDSNGDIVNGTSGKGYYVQAIDDQTYYKALSSGGNGGYTQHIWFRTSTGTGNRGMKFNTYDNAGAEQIWFILDGSGGARFPGSIATTASAANAVIDNANSNQLLRSTSSLRYKTNIEDIEETYANNILKLRPVWYRSLTDHDRSDWSWYGLIAEEVAEIEPRLVNYSYTEDDYEKVKNADGTFSDQLKTDAKLVPDSVQYDRIAVLMLNVVKQQQKAIETLEARIAALENI